MAAAPTTRPPPPVVTPGIITLNNRVTDGQIVSTLYLMAVIGVICFIIFIIFRRGIKLYQTRLYLANVIFKPPEMLMTGHHQIWSWLVPIFTVKDEEIIRSCGLDSLMIVRVAALGVQLFFPITVLACVVLLPTYMSQNYLAEQHAAGDVASTSTPFSRATMGNIPRASPIFWVPFVYVYIVVIYASWLLRYHYKEYVRLRQRYLGQGEVSVNEWHEHFIGQGPRTTLHGVKALPPPSSAQRASIQSIVRHWTGLSKRHNEEGNGSDDEDLDDRRTSDMSVEDGEANELRRRNLRRNSSSTSQGSSPLLRKLASRRAARARSASRGGASQTPSYTAGADGPTSPTMLPPLSPAAGSAAGHPVLHTPGAPSPPGPAPGSVSSTPAAAPAAAAGTPAATVPTQAAAGQDAADAATGNGSVQGGAQRRNTASQTGNYLEQVFRRAESDVRRSRMPGQGMDSFVSGRSDAVVASPDTAPSLARMDMSEAATSDVDSILQQQWTGTSRYETGEGRDSNCDSGVVVYKWWQGHRDPHGHLLSGKPNVWARKVVNTKNAEGRVVGVMAQQYVVLVEDVPDPAQQQGWKHTEVGRIVWKALRRKQKAATFKEGQPVKQGAPVFDFHCGCTRSAKCCQA